MQRVTLSKSAKQFIIATLLIATVWLSLFFSIRADYQFNKQQYLNNLLTSQQIHWTAVQSLFIGNVKLCYESYIQQPYVLDLLKKSQDETLRQQVRIDLYRHLYNHYKARLDYTKGRFDMHFHTLDKKSLLRFGQPEMFGDDLAPLRPTIVAAHKTLEPVHSFDIGRILASYHHVMPIIDNGELLGTIEYGRPFSSLQEALIRFTPNFEYGIIYHQGLANQKRLKKFNNLYATSRFSDDWLEEDPDSLLDTASKPASPLFKEVAQHLKQNASFQQKLKSGESFSLTYQVDDQYYALSLTAIPDITGTNFAYLIGLNQSSELAALTSRYHHHIITMSSLILLIGFGLFLMLGSIRRNKKQARYLESINDTISEGLFVTDQLGNITVANDAAQNILGYSEKQLVGKSASNLFINNDTSGLDSEHENSPLELAYKQGQSFNGELHFVTAENRDIWVDISCQPLINQDEIQGSVTVFSDISESKAKDDALRISATAFETQDGIMITSANGIILRVNQAFTRLTGYQSEEVIGKSPKILSSGRQDEDFYDEMWKKLKADRFWQGEIWNRRKDDKVYLEWLTITAVLNELDEVTHYVANFSDVTDRHLAQDKIQKLAFYDSLTKLPNRRLLLDRLEQAIRYSKRTNQCGALFFLDLDNFKTLNDAKGHLVGDMLLQEVAKRLQNAVREVDTIARLGGDEFVVLLENLGECKVNAVQQSEKLAFTILEAFNAPFDLQGESHHSSPSIGVEIVHPNNQETNEILAHADLAMYQAKKQGRNTVRFFNPEMQTKIDKMVELQSELRQALEEQSLELYYQPQVNQSGQIIGAEALIRWIHPEKGFISPAEFIPMAENSGLIIPLGDFVLQSGCEALVNWAKHPTTKDIKLSVNVSAKQFAEVHFVEKVKNVISETGVNPNYLKLELTESLVVQDVERTIDTMNELRDMGVRFSMDDFGTGHSSLSYLKRLPLSQLKIDQSFIRDLMTDSEDAAIVKTIIAMSNTLKLEVVAEGVETVEQKDFLKNNRCFIYQGYLFSRPIPLTEFNNLIQSAHEINDLDFDLEP